MSDAFSLVHLLVYAMATARLTGLATGTDEVFAPQVLWLVKKINPDMLESGWRFKISYMVTCMWCASFWLGLFLLAPIAYWYPAEPWALIPASALAYSWFTGATSGWGRD